MQRIVQLLEKMEWKPASNWVILVFFVVMSYLDYVVHDTLYSYGLQFSYDWAYPYWTAYGLVYLLFLIGAKSKLGFALWIGGFQDLLTNLLWQRSSLLQTWWWHPFHWIGLPWCALTQIGFLVLIVFTYTMIEVHWWFPRTILRPEQPIARELSLTINAEKEPTQ